MLRVTLVITATGKWKVDAEAHTIEVTADGYGSVFGDTPFKGSFAALIGRIGENGNPFLVGSNFKSPVAGNGRLFLQMNDVIDAHGDNVGELKVTLELK